MLWKPKEVSTFDRSMTSSQLFASATIHNSYDNFYLLGVSRASGNRLHGGYIGIIWVVIKIMVPFWVP